MGQSRQLAAIMFTDVVGYTSIMGKDERKAFEILTKNRDIQKPIIARFHGQWIKELGGGTMASFKSVSNAIAAAIEIQQACNTTSDFKLRIGIHQGEVVFENNDVFGDGVNIAARIQAQTTAGGVWISEAVNQSVSDMSEIHTEFIKAVHLKNVKDPVRIYEVVANGVSRLVPEIRTGTGVSTQGSEHHILSSEAIIRPLILSLVLLLVILVLYLLFFKGSL